METRYELVQKDFSSGEEIVGHIKTLSAAQTLGATVIVNSLYLVLILKLLPTFMKGRQPFKLKRTLLVYNAFQVALSGYMVFVYTRYMFRHGLIIRTCPQGEDLQEVINDILPYFIAKHLDLLDTVFFVLRSKEKQITFLHLYHHNTMVMWAWLYYMYYPTDHFVFVGLLNNIVHVLMYTYYGISSMGPEYAKYVWWKKHLTIVQLVQFILGVSNLYYQQKMTPCPIPTGFHVFAIFCVISFFILFMQFYFRSYRSKSRRHAEVDVKSHVKLEKLGQKTAMKRG